MLQFDLQFYEELTVAWVRTVKFISGAFFWPTGQLVICCCVTVTLKKGVARLIKALAIYEFIKFKYLGRKMN